ncbi:MAG: portal protein [Acidiferrobacterales bacterium]
MPGEFKIDRGSREYIDKRFGAMKSEHQTFVPHLKDLARFVQPRRGRFFTTDRNRGGNRYGSIINSAATQAHRTARAGLFAGTMSPSRPWFSWQTPDPDLMDFHPVKVWIERQEKLIRAIFNSGNLYAQAPVMLGELLLFGTGCMTHVDDFDDVARFYTQTVGSYMIAQDQRFVVNTLAREFMRSTEQLIDQFGLATVSQTVRNAYDRGDYDTQFPVRHFLDPNPKVDLTSPLSSAKPFRSIYYEPGRDHLENKFLSVRGFDEFPAYCPRWDVAGEDIYGTDCPGMTALGDVKGLQLEERRKAQAIDKMVNPPLRGPAALKNVPINSLPGGSTLYDSNSPANILAPVYQVNPQVAELAADIEKVEGRIDEAFYVNLFNAISDMDGIQPRNQEELLQRNQERLLQLGPVLERVHGEFLAKMVDRTFNQSARAGLISPAPPEIQGKELDIRFISSLAMAQRAVATGSIERTAGYVGGLVQAGFEEAGDKFDADQSIDEFANSIGAPARIIVPDEDVERVRETRQRQQQALMAAQMMKDVGPSLTKAGQTNLDENSPISGIANEAVERAG